MVKIWVGPQLRLES
jgi:hypothetical protein